MHHQFTIIWSTVKIASDMHSEICNFSATGNFVVVHGEYLLFAVGFGIRVCSLERLVLRLTTSRLLLFKQLRCMIQQKHTTLLWQLLLRHQVLLLSIHCRLMQQLSTRLQSTHRSMTRLRKPTILWRQLHHLLFQLRCTLHCQPNQSIKHVCKLYFGC